MGTLIIAATQFEIKPARTFLKKAGINTIITGVGCPMSIYVITKAIQTLRPTLIIQAGIAGCFNKDINLGNVFAVSSDYFGDIGVIEDKQWKSVFDMGFIKEHQPPFKRGKLNNPYKTLIKKHDLETVPAVTVNEISTNKNKIELFKKSGVVLESMEGAALHYVALLEKVPFIQIRSVSNYVGERDKSKWRIKSAVDNLNVELIRLISSER